MTTEPDRPAVALCGEAALVDLDLTARWKGKPFMPCSVTDELAALQGAAWWARDDAGNLHLMGSANPPQT